MNPSIFSYPHHNPFGMLTPGRDWSAGSEYRFGFNGQEQVDEVYGNGNLNTAMFWEYDTRLGRRWNVDPVDQFQSNYAVFLNNPVLMIDFDGMSPKVPWELRVDEDGNTSYEATSAKDDIYSFMSEYNVDFKEASNIFKTNNLNDFVPPANSGIGKPVGIGTKINSGYKQLNWQKASDQLLTNQFIQSIYLENLNPNSVGLLDLEAVYSGRPVGVDHMMVSGQITVNKKLYSDLSVTIPKSDKHHGQGRYINTRYIESQGQFQGNMNDSKVSYDLTNYYKDSNNGLRVLTVTISLKSNQASEFYDEVFWPK